MTHESSRLISQNPVQANGGQLYAYAYGDGTRDGKKISLAHDGIEMMLMIEIRSRKEYV